jgi:hypothetical protein
MRSLPKHAILLASEEWCKAASSGKVKVYDFFKTRKQSIRALSSGSVCVVLTKGSNLFYGEFKVKKVEQVDAKKYEELAGRGLIHEPQQLGPHDKVWVIPFDDFVEYPRKVHKRELRDVKTATSKKPISEWQILGLSIIDQQALEGIRRHAEKPPSHGELVEELLNLGEWLGFVVKKEVSTPDETYRLDVVWSDSEGHAPLKAFEVEVSGNVDTALARLAHAYDMWHCEQLWLIVNDEARKERAEKLIEPRLSGSFAKIKEKVKILGWKELHDMYMSIKPYSDLVKELSRR